MRRNHKRLQISLASALVVLLATGVLAFSATPAPAAGNKYAVLVGIDDYPAMPGPLKYCVNDLRGLRESLIEHCGFDQANIYTLEDAAATNANLTDVINNHVAPVEAAADTVVFMFSGHGTPDMGSGCGIYLMDGVMLDAELNTLLGALDSTRQVLLFDSCFSGGFKSAGTGTVRSGNSPAAAAGSGVTAPTGSPGNIFSSLAKSGRDVLAACDTGEESEEYNDIQHGLFIYYFLQALTSWNADTNRDGRIDTDEAHAWLRPRVLSYSQDRHAEDSGNPVQHAQMSAGVAGGVLLSFLSTVLHLSSASASSGAPGSTVVLQGYAFGSEGVAPEVYFGSTRSSVISWSNTSIQCKVPEGLSGTANVTVRAGTLNSNALAFTVTTPAWYLAEGSTSWGFSTYISIQNPNPEPLTAHITYMPRADADKTETVHLNPFSQTTLTNDHLMSFLGESDFSTKIECSEPDKFIAVDRTMMWTGGDASCGYGVEAHSSVGVTGPSRNWYLPEGSSAWGFETWVLIQNPGTSEASCDLTYMIEGEGPRKFTKQVPAGSRMSFNMRDDVGEKDASIKVESDRAVIAERAMYRNARREGHGSIGATAPASSCYLAEGTSAWGFTTYVLVQNPNATAVDVAVTYMTSEGAKPQPAFSLPANSRKTIRVNDVLPDKDFSTVVTGSSPVIAERAMYWNSGTGEACHDSIGMTCAHASFYLPDGEAGPDVETWVLVQNPGTGDVTVDITYMTPSGEGDVTRTEAVPANSRRSFNMISHSGIVGRASVLVTCKTAGAKVMAERAMYWNSRGAGTDTIGAFSD